MCECICNVCVFKEVTCWKLPKLKYVAKKKKKIIHILFEHLKNLPNSILIILRRSSVSSKFQFTNLTITTVYFHVKFKFGSYLKNVDLLFTYLLFNCFFFYMFNAFSLKLYYILWQLFIKLSMQKHNFNEFIRFRSVCCQLPSILWE